MTQIVLITFLFTHFRVYSLPWFGRCTVVCLLTLSLPLDIVLVLLIPVVYLKFDWSVCGRVFGRVDSVSFVWGGCQVLLVPLGFWIELLPLLLLPLYRFEQAFSAGYR